MSWWLPRRTCLVELCSRGGRRATLEGRSAPAVIALAPYGLENDFYQARIIPKIFIMFQNWANKLAKFRGLFDQRNKPSALRASPQGIVEGAGIDSYTWYGWRYPFHHHLPAVNAKHNDNSMPNHCHSNVKALAQQRHSNGTTITMQ